MLFRQAPDTPALAISQPAHAWIFGLALRALRLTARLGEAAAFTLASWPFRADALVLESEARLLPDGRFAEEAAMRAWLAKPERVAFRTRLTPG